MDSIELKHNFGAFHSLVIIAWDSKKESPDEISNTAQEEFSLFTRTPSKFIVPGPEAKRSLYLHTVLLDITCYLIGGRVEISTDLLVGYYQPGDNGGTEKKSGDNKGGSI